MRRVQLSYSSLPRVHRLCPVHYFVFYTKPLWNTVIVLVARAHAGHLRRAQSRHRGDRLQMLQHSEHHLQVPLLVVLGTESKKAFRPSIALVHRLSLLRRHNPVLQRAHHGHRYGYGLQIVERYIFEVEVELLQNLPYLRRTCTFEVFVHSSAEQIG